MSASASPAFVAGLRILSSQSLFSGGDHTSAVYSYPGQISTAATNFFITSSCYVVSSTQQCSCPSAPLYKHCGSLLVGWDMSNTWLTRSWPLLECWVTQHLTQHILDLNSVLPHVTSWPSYPKKYAPHLSPLTSALPAVMSPKPHILPHPPSSVILTPAHVINLRHHCRCSDHYQNYLLLSPLRSVFLPPPPRKGSC